MDFLPALVIHITAEFPHDFAGCGSVPRFPPRLVLGGAQAMPGDVAFVKAHEFCFDQFGKARLIFQ